MAITRTAIVDDDGSGTTGTVIDNAWKTEFYNQIDAALGTRQYVYSTTTGSVADWGPGITGSAIIQWAGTADLTLGGLQPVATGGIVTIIHAGSASAVIRALHQYGGATYRFYNAAQSGATPVGWGGWITYVFNGSSWVLIDHEQGSWITDVYAAGDYTASAGTWTVDAADVEAAAYRLSGKTLGMSLRFSNTSVSATPAYLGRKVLGGFTIPTQGSSPLMLAVDAGAVGTAYTNLVSGTVLQFYRVGAASWGTSANSTTLTSVIQVMVT